MRAPAPGVPTALLITDEDCWIEDFDLPGLNICATATLLCRHLRSPRPVGSMVDTFERAALADAALRLDVSPAQLMAHDRHDLADWAVAGGAKQIFTPFVTRGPLRDWLTRAEPFLAHHSITLCEQRRILDDAIWPHATAGFFKVRKQIPRILEETGLV
jgi:deoxyribodipyrimidine photo-lyase